MRHREKGLTAFEQLEQQQNEVTRQDSDMPHVSGAAAQPFWCCEGKLAQSGACRSPLQHQAAQARFTSNACSLAQSGWVLACLYRSPLPGAGRVSMPLSLRTLSVHWLWTLQPSPATPSHWTPRW